MLLIAVSVKLLTLFDRDVHAWASDFVSRHGIDIANKFVQSGLERLVGIGNTQLVELSIGATIYAGLLFTEGIGLWLQKRWAEYMTAFLTAIFIPVELYEIYERFTWVRIGILALNIFVVWYLSTRLKDEKFEDSSLHGAKDRRPKIKICGITNLKDALLASKLGADQLGFNFYDKSPRYISPESAAAIIAQLPPGISKAGVFVNDTVERICETVSVAGLDTIQLHGGEDIEFVERIERSGLTVIKAIRVTPEFRLEDVRDFDGRPVLLDGYSITERGGTGGTFDWEIAKQVSRTVPELYLAGGLTPENVSEAIKKVRPFAVDACSRIESEPGKKDEDKLMRFIAAVRETI
ncbi:hypothetical protein BH10ACI3_BH10ACI3_03170 [soil metagenome]